MADHVLERIEKDRVEKHWDLWQHWLRHVPRNGLYDESHVLEWLRSGARTLWAVWDVSDGMELVACLTTAVEEYPLRRVGRICELAGRDMTRWLDLLPQLEDAFRAVGCEVVDVYGRKGWARVLNGYELHASVIRKEL